MPVLPDRGLGHSRSPRSPLSPGFRRGRSGWEYATLGWVPVDVWWEATTTAGVEGCDSNDSVLSLSGCIFGVGRASSGGVPGTERSTRPAPSCLGMEARFLTGGLDRRKATAVHVLMGSFVVAIIESCCQYICCSSADRSFSRCT